MRTKTHRTQIYLTQRQYQYLRQQGEINKISIAEVVRKLIDEKLSKDDDYKDNPLFSIGKDGFSMGIERGSINHDDYIYNRN